jgi:hypothetical protein
VEEVREANRARLLARLRGYWQFYIKYQIIYLILNISSDQFKIPESQLIFFLQQMVTARVAVRSLTGRALSLTARLAERSTHSQNSERVIGERLSARSLGLRGSGR